MMLVVDCPGVRGTTITDPPPRANLRRPDDGVLGVVSPLHQDVGTQSLDQLERRILIKEHDAVHHLESGHDIRALRFATNRPGGTLQPAHGVVAVDRDDQRVALAPRADEHVDVSRMQEVEDAVGEHHASSLGRAPARRVGPVVDL